MEQQHESRVAARVPFLSEVVITVGQRRLACTSVDLSATGMLLLPPARAGAGLPVELALPLLSTAPSTMSLSAIVARECSSHGHYAWGVQFVDVSPDTRKALIDLVARLERASTTGAHPAVPARGRVATNAHDAQREQGGQTVTPSAPFRATGTFRADPRIHQATGPLPAQSRPEAATNRERSVQGTDATEGHRASPSSGSYRRVYSNEEAKTATQTHSRQEAPASPGRYASAARPAIPASGGTRSHDLQARYGTPFTRDTPPNPPPRMGHATGPQRRETPSTGHRATRQTRSAKPVAQSKRGWDPDSHMTPIDIQELYQLALDEIEGTRKKGKS